MKTLQPSLPSIAVAVLGLGGAAVHGLGFAACDVELTKLFRGLGFLSPLLLAAPTGMGLLVVSVFEAVAAMGLFIGAVMVLCGRRSGMWVSLVASVPGLLTGLLLVTHLVSAPLIFGKTMAGLPTDAVAWMIFAYGLASTIAIAGLAFSLPKRSDLTVQWR